MRPFRLLTIATVFLSACASPDISSQRDQLADDRDVIPIREVRTDITRRVEWGDEHRMVVRYENGASMQFGCAGLRATAHLEEPCGLFFYGPGDLSRPDQSADRHQAVIRITDGAEASLELFPDGRSRQWGIGFWDFRINGQELHDFILLISDGGTSFQIDRDGMEYELPSLSPELAHWFARGAAESRDLAEFWGDLQAECEIRGIDSKEPHGMTHLISTERAPLHLRCARSDGRGSRTFLFP